KDVQVTAEPGVVSLRWVSVTTPQEEGAERAELDLAAAASLFDIELEEVVEEHVGAGAAKPEGSGVGFPFADDGLAVLAGDGIGVAERVPFFLARALLVEAKQGEFGQVEVVPAGAVVPIGCCLVQRRRGAFLRRVRQSL